MLNYTRKTTKTKSDLYYKLKYL